MMINENVAELRRIRITLIVLTIIILFSGNDTVTVDHLNNESYQTEYYNNTIQLKDGHFGVVSGQSDWEGADLKIYYYDPVTNQVTIKKEVPFDAILPE